MKKQTAVDYFNDALDDILELYPSEWIEIQKIFEQAKSMEKEQSQKYAEFCVECDRKGMPLLDFKSWIEL